MENDNQGSSSCTVFTVKEVSERWGLPTSCLYDMIKAGAIPILNIPGGKRILREFIYKAEESAEFNPRDLQSQKVRTLEREVDRLSQERVFLSQELEKKNREIKTLLSQKGRIRR